MIIFADKSGNIALADLDANFAEVGVYAETAGKVLDAVQDNIRQIGPLTAPLVVSGNITATTGYYFHGDGSKLTNLPIANSTYGNSNVASYLPTYTGAFSPSNINASGIVQGLSMISRGAITASGVVTGAGFSTGGDVDSRGTVIGRNFSTSGNANVTNNVNANNMTATGQITASGTISATGNIISLGNISASNNIFTQNFQANGNANINGYANIGTLTVGNITTNGIINGTLSLITNGNITAKNFVGNVILGSATAAVIQTITGTIGSIIAISDSPICGGRLAFWDTTNGRWSYVSDNSAV